MDQKMCSVVSDLLPLYTENMVSPDTKKMIASHLQECENCRRRYEQLTDRVLPPGCEERLKEAVPLKKLRFSIVMNVLSAPIWLPLLLAAAICCIAVWISLFAGIVVLWCIPLGFGCMSLASIPAMFASAISGFGGNILFFAGILLASIPLSVFCASLCGKLTVLFFRATGWLLKKLFRRKKSANQTTVQKGNY